MSNTTLSFLAAPLIVLGSLNATAENPLETPVTNSGLDKIGLVFNFELMTGGDELGYIQFDDGTKESVHAGSGVGFGAGVNYQLLPQVKAEVTLNYLSDSVSGDTAGGDSIEIDFTRYPVDVMGFYQHQKHSVGAGLTYHMSPSLSSGSDNVDFDAALGSILEYRYFFTPQFSVDLKMVNIDYEFKQVTFDGSSFGLGVAGYF
jgi:hypothetical protein